MCGKARKLKTSIECDLAEYCEALNLLRQRVHLGPIWTEFRVFYHPFLTAKTFAAGAPPGGGLAAHRCHQLSPKGPLVCVQKIECKVWPNWGSI